MNKNKNQEIIIKALSKIENRNNIKYILCGKGENLEYLRNISLSLKIEKNILFVGYRKDVLNILKSSDIFCFSSKREGLSVAMMEAMACNLPVVCSKIRGNTDLVLENKGGFLYDFNDIDNFKYGIERLVNDKKLRKDMGQFNFHRIKEFDKENVNAIMKKIYEGGV